jgi:hypothetical protein
MADAGWIGDRRRPGRVQGVGVPELPAIRAGANPVKAPGEEAPGAPTADRLRRFIGLETDWIRALRAASPTLGGSSVLLFN